MTNFNPIANVPINSPMMAKTTFHISPRILPALENIWMNTHTFDIECPYPNSLRDNLKYTLTCLRRFKFVPFANMGGNELVASAYEEGIQNYLNGLDAHLDRLLENGIKDQYVIDIPLGEIDNDVIEEGDVFPFTVTIGFTLQSVDTLGNYRSILDYAVALEAGVERDELITTITGEPQIPMEYLVSEGDVSEHRLQMKLAIVTNSLKKTIQTLVGKALPVDKVALVDQAKSYLRGQIRDLNKLLVNEGELPHIQLGGYDIQRGKSINLTLDDVMLKHIHLGGMLQDPDVNRLLFISKVDGNVVTTHPMEKSVDRPLTEHPSSEVFDEYAVFEKMIVLTLSVNHRLQVGNRVYPCGLIAQGDVIELPDHFKVTREWSLGLVYACKAVMQGSEPGIELTVKVGIELDQEYVKRAVSHVFHPSVVNFDDQLTFTVPDGEVAKRMGEIVEIAGKLYIVIDNAGSSVQTLASLYKSDVIKANQYLWQEQVRCIHGCTIDSDNGRDSAVFSEDVAGRVVTLPHGSYFCYYAFPIPRNEKTEYLCSLAELRDSVRTTPFEKPAHLSLQRNGDFLTIPCVEVNYAHGSLSAWHVIPGDVVEIGGEWIDVTSISAIRQGVATTYTIAGYVMKSL